MTNVLPWLDPAIVPFKNALQISEENPVMPVRGRLVRNRDVKFVAVTPRNVNINRAAWPPFLRPHAKG